jgi:hypothetical protein
MKRFLLGLGLVGGVIVLGSDALACGDKLVVVGRGLRPKGYQGAKPASILLYADPNGSLPAALEQGNLRKDLEKAGHRLRSVGTREELDTALSTGSYDLVFADFKTAASLESEASAAPSKPTVMPTLFNPTDSELAAAAHQYHCVVKSPRPQKDYLAVVNEVLAQRAKQAKPALAEKKK